VASTSIIACIFGPLQDLALGQLATAFALLRMPRMPEIKLAKGAMDGFTPSTVDPETGELAPAWLPPSCHSVVGQ
jgi:hypothetical protein